MGRMTPHAGRSKVATAAAVAVVLICCVVVTSGQEDATEAATITTTTDDDLTTQVIPGEEDSFNDEATTAPESDGDTNEGAKEATSPITTTNITTTTTTTPSAVEKETTLAPSAPDTTEGGENTTTANVTTAATTQVTQAPSANITTTTAAVTCGVNADLKEGECVCRPPWIHDPTNPESPCTCPDLCRTERGVICPPESSCRQVSCNLAICTCPDPLVYSASTSSCISPCQLYGDAVCGLGSGWKCLEEDEGRSFTCQCAEGYTLREGECQDIDECTSEAGSPCDTNEQCVNSDGSYKCACQDGFLRVANGSCINMNECLNPRLHNCDHLCHDAQPPTRYTCDCFPGHTWNNTLQHCVLDDPKTSCECGPSERSVCIQSLEGEKQCFPRPGFTKNDTAFIDASECGDPSIKQAWCWARGQCVEGVGSSECVCAKGFANDPPHTADCVRVSCPEGMLLAGSECVDPCSSVACPPPFTCQVHGTTTEPSCRCLSRCLSLQQPDSNLSIYHGSFLVHDGSKDFDTSRRVVRALEDYFGPNSAEVVSVSKLNSTELPASQQTNVSVEFALMISQPNMSHELPEAIRSLCRDVEGQPSLCVLAGGLQLVKASVTSTDKDPCGDDPCPSEHNFTCRIKANVTGRFVCDCASGFSKVDIPNSLGYCQDVNECEGEKLPCGSHEECINTLGGFTCRSKSTSLGQNPETVQEMAIAFGVLFFVALLALIAVACLLKKKHKATRELVPMTTGFDNSAYK